MDKIIGVDVGDDDYYYMNKPFISRESIPSIKDILRRTVNQELKNKIQNEVIYIKLLKY
ncbi:MAG: hypothetical protein KAJ79_05175 [Candidatus Omnitrophica bacterium]|nr:hypothetical protein [Candidatus Omnitrophota bacterium]MCK5288434.1 hypothetical protein [Candidatus Omnitrophota bacterium]